MSPSSLAERPLLVVVNNDWFSPAAAVVTMENLLKWLSPKEFVVACAWAPRPRGGIREADPGMRVYPVFRAPVTGASWRLDEMIRRLYFSTALPSRALERLARRYNCGAVLCVYPDLRAIVVAHKVATSVGLPLAIYLHDTIVEGARTRDHAYATRVQATLFASNHLFFSMSEGLAELLARKYNLRTVPLPHCYDETPPPLPATRRASGCRTALFSGSIYDNNRPAVARVAKAAIRAGYGIVCTKKSAATIMVADGIPAASIMVKSLPSRAEYLAFLAEQGALFLALSWPDESAMHRDELATMFPTKVPEYLGAGRPILVHCPGDYALADFVRKYQCGLVVPDRTEEALLNAWTELRDHPDTAFRLAANARQVLPYFDGQRISNVFRQHIEALTVRG